MSNLFIKVLQLIGITFLVLIINGVKKAPEHFLQTGIIKEKNDLNKYFIIDWTSGHLSADKKVYVIEETFNKYKLGDTVSFKRKGNLETYYNLPSENVWYQFGLVIFTVLYIFLLFIELVALSELVGNKDGEHMGVLSSIITFLSIDIKKLA